jgi:hypothetical protein
MSGKPDLVRRGRGELVPGPTLVVDHREQVVMDRRPGLTRLALAAVVGGEDTGGRAQSPHPVLRSRDADVGELVGEEPVAERGVVLVDPQQSVDDVSVVPVSLGHGLLEPLVVPLGRQAQDPARHRDRHPDAGTGRGHLTDEREDYFPGRFACDR